MPIYEFRTEAQDGSGHYRAGRQEADSKEHARMILEQRELEFALYQMTPERVAEIEAEHGPVDALPQAAPLKASEEEKAVFRALPRDVRQSLSLHRQEKPYKLVKLEKAG